MPAEGQCSLRELQAATDAFLRSTTGAVERDPERRYGALARQMDRALHRLPDAAFDGARDDVAAEFDIARTLNTASHRSPALARSVGKLQSLRRVSEERRLVSTLLRSDGVPADIPLTAQRMAFTVPRVERDLARADTRAAATAALGDVDAEARLQSSLGHDKHIHIYVLKFLLIALFLVLLVLTAVSMYVSDVSVPPELKATFYALDAATMFAIGVVLFFSFKLHRSGLRTVPHPADQTLAWLSGVLFFVLAIKTAGECYTYIEEHV